MSEEQSNISDITKHAGWIAEARRRTQIDSISADDYRKTGSGMGGGGGGMNDDVERRLGSLEAVIPTLATKSDIDELRLATKDDLKQLATKTEFESFRSEVRALVAEAKSDIIKWGSTIVFSATAIIIAVLGIWFTLALRSISTVSAPQDRSSVTINVPSQPATVVTPQQAPAKP